MCPGVRRRPGATLSQRRIRGVRLGIGAQSQLDNRHLTEDVGYSSVFLTDLAGRVGIETPTMEALITMTSVVLTT